MAVRPELPDGSIPLSEPGGSQRIIWTDPRDTDIRGLAFPTKLDAGVRPVETRSTPHHPAGNGIVASTGTARPRATPSSALVPPARQSPAKSNRPRTPTTLDKDTSDYVSPYETFDPRLTRTGARLGTGAYMAPEQFRDPRSVDVRADLYAFGVVLFEMITGSLPFNGRSLDSLSHQHSRYKPPSIVPSVHHRHAKLAKRVDEIVQRCLHERPGRPVRQRRRTADGTEANAGSAPAEVTPRILFFTGTIRRGERHRSIVSRPSARPGDGCWRAPMPQGGYSWRVCVQV